MAHLSISADSDRQATAMARLDEIENKHYHKMIEQETLNTRAYEVIQQFIEWANFTCCCINADSVQFEADDIEALKTNFQDFKDITLPF